MLVQMSIAALAVGVAMASPAAAADNLAAMQERLYQALKSEKAISAQTKLVSARYVCTLLIKTVRYNVIDVVEHVHGAQVPRGINSIVLLDDSFKIQKKIDYADQYPLFCRGSRLYIHGDIGIDNTEPYGNTLNFESIGDIAVSSTEPNDFPIPITSLRSTYLLK